MIRPVRADGRIDSGGLFTPILRPRVIERIASAAVARILLIIAPAGYGKSVALRQYLDTVAQPYVRYDVHPENAALLGFVRGFADQLSQIAPHVRKTVSGAYEKSGNAPSPGIDLAMWMHAHIKAFTGIIAIDDLHVAENDPEITKFIVSLTERTKGRVRWAIASRTALDLPVASWMAYGDMNLSIDEIDLRLTIDEARATAKAARVGVRDEELTEILELTEGWPTALSFALRSSTRSVDLRGIAASTREMIYSFLAEQVYKGLSSGEQQFLKFAALLPEIDLAVVKHGGFDRGKHIVEELRSRVSFIYAERPGVYRCHDLFGDFLRHELELEGEIAYDRMRLQAADALEKAGTIPAALVLYGQARSDDDVLRLLECFGFGLIEQGHDDAIQSALAVLPAEVQRTHSWVLGMRALHEAGLGKSDKAESLFERAIAKAADAEARAQLAIRLALVLINQDRDVTQLLGPLLASPGVSQEAQGEMTAILAGYYALTDNREMAVAAIEQTTKVLRTVDSDVVRAKMWQRLGFAAQYLGDVESAKKAATQAAELAIECGLYSLASRAYILLSNTCQLEDDVPRRLWYAQQAALTSTKAGNSLDVQTALVIMLDIEVQRGNSERVRSVERQLAGVNMADADRLTELIPARALQYAWTGAFSEAHRTLAGAWERHSFPIDRIATGAFCALYFAADGRHADASETIARVHEMIRLESWTSRNELQTLEIVAALGALTEAVCGRATVAFRMLRRPARVGSPITSALSETVTQLIRSMQSPAAHEAFSESLEPLRVLGFGGYAMALQAIFESRVREQHPKDACLTQSELAVLQSLAGGFSPKEIAADSGRSVLTVQTHIKNAIEKLGCRGRQEAIIAARNQGLMA